MKLSTRSNVSSEPGIRRGRADLGEQLVLVGTARRTAMARMCWASTSSAPGRKTSGSSSPSSIASSAARASRYSKRLPGTSMPLLGSSSRWLARPIRCSRRERALGRAHLDDAGRRRPSRCRGRGWRSRPAPRSLPARHRRLDLAPRLDRQAAVVDADRQRLSSFASHRFWKISSARPRVLQKTSVVLCCSISRMTSAIAW